MKEPASGVPDVVGVPPNDVFYSSSTEESRKSLLKYVFERNKEFFAILAPWVEMLP